MTLLQVYHKKRKLSSFETWLKTQRDRHDAVGDLARYVCQVKLFFKSVTWRGYKNYLYSSAYIAGFEQAWDQYHEAKDGEHYDCDIKQIQKRKKIRQWLDGLMSGT
jgi:uncharacterized protein YozE (UPF0346 family)